MAVSDDADTASGAARAAAAHAGMRNVVAQAGLDHAETLRHPDRPAMAGGQVNKPAAALREGARPLGQQGNDQQAKKADQEIIRALVQDTLSGRCACLGWFEIPPPPFDAVAVD